MFLIDEEMGNNDLIVVFVIFVLLLLKIQMKDN